jgi:hypothetical protein
MQGVGLECGSLLSCDAIAKAQRRTRESLADKLPIAKLAPHKLLKEEQEEIGRSEGVIQERKKRHLATQQRSKEINRHMMEQTSNLRC